MARINLSSRRSGKTEAVRRMTEQLLDRGLKVTSVDVDARQLVTRERVFVEGRKFDVYESKPFYNGSKLYMIGYKPRG